MDQILETERLRLRKFTFDDTRFIVELLNTPGWLKFIGDRNVRNEEEARLYLQNGPFRSFELHGFGLAMVERKVDGAAVGMCGLLKRENLNTPDLGFAFLPTFHGQGYAREVTLGMVEHAKDILKIPRLSAITLPENTRSIKLLESIGFSLTDQVLSKEEALLVYSL